MSRTMAATAAALMTMAAPLAQSAVLVGTTIAGPGLYNVGSQSRLQNTGGTVSATFDNQSLAQGFSLTSAVVANDLAVYVGYANQAATFTFRITDKIGAGTTAADVLYTGTGTFGATAALLDFSLGSLSLAAGNYYLVLSSDTLTPTPNLNGSNCAGGLPGTNGISVCVTTGYWGGAQTATNLSTAGTLTGGYTSHNFTTGTAGASPALTTFSPGVPNGLTMFFQLNGIASPVPELPTTALWLAAAGMAAAWRLRPARRRSA